MSSTDEQRAISGSSAGGKRIRLNLDESTTSAKVYIEMPAAHKVNFSQTNFTFNLSRKEVPWRRDREKANA